MLGFELGECRARAHERDDGLAGGARCLGLLPRFSLRFPLPLHRAYGLAARRSALARRFEHPDCLGEALVGVSHYVGFRGFGAIRRGGHRAGMVVRIGERERYRMLAHAHVVRVRRARAIVVEHLLPDQVELHPRAVGRTPAARHLPCQLANTRLVEVVDDAIEHFARLSQLDAPRVGRGECSVRFERCLDYGNLSARKPLFCLKRQGSW